MLSSSMHARHQMATTCTCLNVGSLLMRADPFANDESFVLSVLTLEELGATGNKARHWSSLVP